MRSRLLNIFFALLMAAPGLTWSAEPLWIDVRTAEEYAAGHVSEAANIPYEEIVKRIGEVTDDRDALIYLYCRSGRRSGIAREALQEAGFRHVVNIGGFDTARKVAAEPKAD